jgi:septum formation protein
MRRLILASQSPHRLELLRNAGYEVEVVSTDVAEPSLADFSDLDAGLVHIAALKARAAWRRGGRGLIFAADTVGRSAGEVFGKPVDRQDALRMLKAISGTMHDVLTGWCLFRTRDELQISGVERTTITMRSWAEEEFVSYLDSGEWIDKSGAYGLRLPHDPFVTHISGSSSSVVGVPLERLAQVLAEFKL